MEGSRFELCGLPKKIYDSIHCKKIKQKLVTKEHFSEQMTLQDC